MKKNFVPVVLCGGIGSRLWPISREGQPKPFLALPDGMSFLEKTYRRALSLAAGLPVVTVTHQDYFFRAADELARAQAGARGCFILEPMARNTAASVALAARHAAQHWGDETVLLVMPADHLIEPDERFAEAAQRAVQLAGEGYLVTMGIPPDCPETGFGYLEVGEAVGHGGHEVARFTEKPAKEVAEAWLRDGRHLWNSGVFCFTAGRYLAALEEHADSIARAVETVWAGVSGRDWGGREVIEIGRESFAAVPEQSIDYAVMERAARVAVIPAGFSWRDIGSWTAYAELFAADEQGNAVSGDVLLIDGRDNFIHGEGRLVAALGIEGLIVVDTPDALLVADRTRAQDVKEIVKRLKDEGHATATTHRTVLRPWGAFTVLEEGERFKIKRIVVAPGKRLSLQLHHHRSEHWIVVSGMARVTNGERSYFVHANESTFIAAGCAHRLENPGVIDLVMIEVQSGDYVGEDDIVRLDDAYGRSTVTTPCPAA